MAKNSTPQNARTVYNLIMCKNWIIFLSVLVFLGCFTRAQAATPVAIVALHGEVNDYTRGLLERQFSQARLTGATTVILDIDTYGGLVVSGLDITHFIRGQSDLHVIAYVNRAISAGAMIAVSCDEIVMAPSGVIGDCAPIIFRDDGSLNPMPPAERAKAQSPIINDFDASADHGHYNRLLLESMVVTERVVYWVQEPKSHERRFVDQADYDKLTAKGWQPVDGVPNPVDGADTLLTVRTDEAVKLGLATGISRTVESLAAQRGQLIANLTPGPGEKVIEFLNYGWMRSLFMIAFFLSMMIVMGAPGHGTAESIAVISLALLLGVPLLTGYAAWWEVVIIFAGVALLAFEVFVFPGHGVSAGLGILMMIVGLLFTFIGPQVGGGLLPHSSSGWMNLRHGALAIGGAVLGSIFLSTWLRAYLPQLPYFNRLILSTTSGNAGLQNTSAIAPENAWPGVGTSGIAVTDLRPGGSAEFLDLLVGNNRPVAVISETGYVSAGSKLIVRESRGNRIVVRPLAASS